MNFVLAYLTFINLISGIVFAYDKSAAARKQQRIPENSHDLKTSLMLLVIC
jgi:uncharacterized membrane protein YsdA (DUF1294 family)